MGDSLCEKSGEVAPGTVTLHDVIVFMNSLLQADESAVRALVQQRVPCNQALVDHPTVITQPMEDGTYRVGLLGLLNGMLGKAGVHAPLCVVMEVTCPNQVCTNAGKDVEDAREGDHCPLCSSTLVEGRLVRFRVYNPRPAKEEAAQAAPTQESSGT